MDQGNKNESVTLEDSSPFSGASTPLNNSKRKAEDDESDCVIESAHQRKRLCHEGEDTFKPKDSQLITVVFQCEDVARRYSRDITDFIAQLTKSEITTSVEKDGKPCLEFYTGTEEPEKAAGSQSAGNQQSNSKHALPQYDQAFSGVVGVQGAPKSEDKAKPRNVCFNCEGDHMIAMCPEPRDAARIAKNRSAHANKNPVYNRYHEESDQRFDHLTPGQLSAGLREALGLRSDDLPLHTYRMRAQGYPPGWLRSARLQRSNLAVHHEPAAESGKEITKPVENEEEHYDLNKLISFPGFNVKSPDGCRDEHRQMGFPPMQSFWSLRIMKRRLRRAPGARRSGLQRQQPADLPSSARKDVPPSNQNGEGAKPATPAAEATTNGDREGSPSLETLEEQRRALLDSLETPAADGEEGELDDDEEEEEVTEEEKETELVHAPPAACSTPQAQVLTPGASRRRELGTPVAAASPHVAYDAEKWSAGITEHIPYENLPGATGAWDRMSSLMKKVRDQLTGRN